MKNQVAVHDRLYVHAAPFRGQPKKLADLSLRYNDVTWGSDELALVSDWRWV